jgi:PII-like signaling protein
MLTRQRRYIAWRDFWEAGGKLPVIIIFVDTDEHVSRVLPTLKEMAAHRLIVRENVVLEQGDMD